MNQHHAIGDWSCSLTYPVVSKTAKPGPIKTTVIIYFQGKNVFQTTGVLAYHSAKEQIERWHASGYKPSVPKTKCLADYSPAQRIEAGKIPNEKPKL